MILTSHVFVDLFFILGFFFFCDIFCFLRVVSYFFVCARHCICRVILRDNLRPRMIVSFLESFNLLSLRFFGLKGAILILRPTLDEGVVPGRTGLLFRTSYH